MFNEDIVKNQMGIPPAANTMNGVRSGGLNSYYLDSLKKPEKMSNANAAKQDAKNQERLAKAEFDKALAQLLQKMATEETVKKQSTNNTTAFVIGGVVLAAIFVTVAVVLYKKKKAAAV